jgi:ELWxxDGT repeat protein
MPRQTPRSAFGSCPSVSRFVFAATAVLTCTLSVASAQTATRLVDIGSSVGPVVDSKPTDFVQFGPFVYFAAEDPIAGVELWRTGGTPASTTLVADVVPDPRGSFPRSLTVAGDRLFFVATDANGTTASLYVSDGTADGTQAVFVIGQLLAFVPTAELVAIGDRVLGVTRPSGQQILLSDGTPAGTSFLPFAGPVGRLRREPRRAALPLRTRRRTATSARGSSPRLSPEWTRSTSTSRTEAIPGTASRIDQRPGQRDADSVEDLRANRQ